MSDAGFLFVTCQAGAESVCKATLLQHTDQARLAFSRRGCLTFKLGERPQDAREAILRNPFARTWGESLGVLSGELGETLAQRVWQLVGDRPIDQLHVWEVDRISDASRTTPQPLTPLAASIGELIATARGSDPYPEQPSPVELRTNQLARKSQHVLDCVLLAPNEWLIGTHQATTDVGCWPAGLPPLKVQSEAPSRAYLKMLEALQWSKLPVRRGEVILEIGSAPGGSCQALLERGLHVIGVDPAEMDESVLAHPNFEHWRKRGHEIQRRAIRNVRWLSADSNVAPRHTLDTVEALVTHEATHIDGMLLTLKLPDWNLATEIPDYLERIRGWGYRYVKARQLVHNRQEVCVFALRHKALLRVGGRRSAGEN